MVTLLFQIINGADGRSRTGTGCPTTPSRWRVYQFHHIGIYFLPLALRLLPAQHSPATSHADYIFRVLPVRIIAETVVFCLFCSRRKVASRCFSCSCWRNIIRRSWHIAGSRHIQCSRHVCIRHRHSLLDDRTITRPTRLQVR